eukprot:440588-Pelagomonas_calceolata.AAC.2
MCEKRLLFDILPVNFWRCIRVKKQGDPSVPCFECRICAPQPSAAHSTATTLMLLPLFAANVAVCKT